MAAALQLEDERIIEARLALGGVAHKPWRDAEAENFMKGKTAGEKTYAEAARMILKEAKGFKYNQFKIELASRAIVRALSEAQNRETANRLNCYTYNRHHQS